MIQETPFKHELNEIVTKGSMGKHYVFKLIFHLAGGVSFPATSFVLVNRHRDYVDGFIQTLMIQTVTTKGQHEQILMSDQSTLQATLTRYEIGVNAPYSLDALHNPVSSRYKVKLINASSDQVSQNNPLINRTDIGDNLLLQNFYVQLIDPAFDNLRLKTVGGVFRNTSGVDLIKFLLSQYSSQEDKLAASAITGVDVAPNVNVGTRTQIVVPHLTPLTKAINFINENSGGLYSTGFSYFCQAGIWYLYPLYDIRRFEGAERTLTIVNLPKDRVPGLEKTYVNKQSGLIVLATRDAIVIDNREANIVNSGNATSFVDASRLLDGWGEVSGNKLNVKASLNINEVGLSERTDEVSLLKPTEVRITANKNIELSKLAQRRGFLMQLVWENCDDDLIYPGMPTKVLYLKDNLPSSATGIVLEVETNWYGVERSFTNRKMARMCAITVFVGEET